MFSPATEWRPATVGIAFLLPCLISALSQTPRFVCFLFRVFRPYLSCAFWTNTQYVVVPAGVHASIVGLCRGRGFMIMADDFVDLAHCCWKTASHVDRTSNITHRRIGSMGGSDTRTYSSIEASGFSPSQQQAIASVRLFLVYTLVPFLHDDGPQNDCFLLLFSSPATHHVFSRCAFFRPSHLLPFHFPGIFLGLELPVIRLPLYGRGLKLRP